MSNEQVNFASLLAQKLHEGQTYAINRSYFFAHICMVVRVLVDFDANQDEIIAGYLHDSIEDTPITREVIEKLFTPHIANMVWACTGVGDNRRQRNECIYGRISRFPEAAFIKVADRIANLEGATSKYKEMYRKEKDDFFDYVAKYVGTDMQKRLEKAYDD